MALRYAFAGGLYWKILNKFIVKNCSGKGNSHALQAGSSFKFPPCPKRITIGQRLLRQCCGANDSKDQGSIK